MIFTPSPPRPAPPGPSHREILVPRDWLTADQWGAFVDRAMTVGGRHYGILDVAEARYCLGPARYRTCREWTARTIGLGNVWEECGRRNRCRFGLAGVRMRHEPTGLEFEAAGSEWGRHSELYILPGLQDAPARVRASECILLSKWPVVCCRPGRRKSGVHNR